MKPYFRHYTLGEITTGRVEWFLKSERAVSYSRAKHSRTVLNQLFTFALRHDAMQRNPVEGTSPLARPPHQIRALTLEQVQAIRVAAAAWRTGPDVRGPKPDGQVRDAIEVLLGTSMRPGEALALRPCDISDGRRGMVAHVRGTVVSQPGRGTFRQDHPKTDASIRQVPVPDFAAQVLRRRIAALGPGQQGAHDLRQPERRPAHPAQRPTYLPGVPPPRRAGGLRHHAALVPTHRSNGAGPGLGVDVAAAHLGHTSKAITEGHYVEPDRTIDFTPAAVLETTLRPVDPDRALLARPETDEEDNILDEIDPRNGEDAADVA